MFVFYRNYEGGKMWGRRGREKTNIRGVSKMSPHKF